MKLKEKITLRFQRYMLERIQRTVETRRKSTTQSGESNRESQLREWLLAADEVHHNYLGIIKLTLLFSLLAPLLWWLAPILQSAISETTKPPPSHISTAAPKTALPLSQTKIVEATAIPVKRFAVLLKLQQNHPETTQILEKIRQRPLPVKLKTLDDLSGNLLLIDETPATQRDAERLIGIYNQLFGVE